MERVLITGASGVVGRALVARLASERRVLTLAGRSAASATAAAGPHDYAAVGALSARTDWRRALDGCGAVVHLAAQVPGAAVSDSDFTTVNDEATSALARQAAECGVRRFVFMSSIFAITGNAAGAIVSDATIAAPTSAYGHSKLAAEGHVADFASSGAVGVSLRPVLVYGAEASGNWRLLQKLASTGLPLPLGAAHNRRSMIGVDNLVDAVHRVLAKSDGFQSGAYAVADTDPISLADAVRLLREGMSRPARLVAVPPFLLSGLLRAVGKGSLVNSLMGDLIVDASRFRGAFDWEPPETIRDGIRRSGGGFAAAA